MPRTEISVAISDTGLKVFGIYKKKLGQRAILFGAQLMEQSCMTFQKYLLFMSKVRIGGFMHDIIEETHLSGCVLMFIQKII